MFQNSTWLWSLAFGLCLKNEQFHVYFQKYLNTKNVPACHATQFLPFMTTLQLAHSSVLAWRTRDGGAWQAAIYGVRHEPSMGLDMTEETWQQQQQQHSFLHCVFLLCWTRLLQLISIIFVSCIYTLVQSTLMLNRDYLCKLQNIVGMLEYNC